MAEEVKAEASEDSVEKIEISNGHRWQAASELAFMTPPLGTRALCNSPLLSVGWI